MTPLQGFLSQWYFHLPNLALAALTYTLIGRLILEVAFEFFQGNKDAVILRAFRTITDPVLKAVRVITPAIVPNGLVIVLAVVWLFALRVILFLGLALLGAQPKIAG